MKNLKQPFLKGCEVKTCTKCSRKIITELPEVVWRASCAGCNDRIVILPDNDCKQYKYEKQE